MGFNIYIVTVTFSQNIGVETGLKINENFNYV